MVYDYFNASAKMIKLFAKGNGNYVKIANEDMQRIVELAYCSNVKLEIKESADRFYTLCRFR